MSTIENFLSVKRFNLLLLLLFIIPFFSWFFPYAAFVVYLISFFICFKYLVGIPFLFILKLFVLFALFFYHVNSLDSIMNLSALLVADIYSIVIGSMLLKNDFEFFKNKFIKFYFIMILIAFIFSIIFSNIFGLLNPIESILNGGRLLLIAKPTDGHSFLNEVSALSLILLLSSSNKNKLYLFNIIFFSAMLLLAKSMTSILCLITILIIYCFESLNIQRTIKNIIHIFLMISLFLFSSNQNLVNNSLQFVRGNIVGQDLDAYYGDYSAGRNDLNRLLFYYANQSPLFGVGNDHPVLKYGVTLETGAERGATSESPLRLATQYGWILFFLTAFISFIPFFAGFFLRENRKFFILSGYTILIFGSTNAGFSVPQSTLYIFFGPIIWMAWFSLKKKYFNKGYV